MPASPSPPPIVNSSTEVDPIADIPLIEAPQPPTLPQPNLPPILPDIPEVSVPPISPLSPPRSGKFFKILFFISFVIFLGICGTIAYSIFSSSKSGPAVPSVTPTTQNPSPAIINNFCRVNDQTYQIGQTFDAADGCNTCTCMPQLSISCSQLVCEITPTATDSALLSPTPQPTPTLESTPSGSLTLNYFFKVC